MQVGVPSLLESVVMFCHMCNIPSAKVLCVCVCAYESIVRSRMAKVHSLNAYHICIRVCEPACFCTLCQLCGQIETDSKWYISHIG